MPSRPVATVASLVMCWFEPVIKSMVMSFQVDEPLVSGVQVMSHAAPALYMSFGPGPVGVTPEEEARSAGAAETSGAPRARRARMLRAYILNTKVRRVGRGDVWCVWCKRGGGGRRGKGSGH